MKTTRFQFTSKSDGLKSPFMTTTFSCLSLAISAFSSQFRSLYIRMFYYIFKATRDLSNIDLCLTDHMRLSRPTWLELFDSISFCFNLYFAGESEIYNYFFLFQTRNMALNSTAFL